MALPLPLIHDGASALPDWPQTVAHRAAARPLRVAAVPGAPWVLDSPGGLDGLEVRALDRYCRWRGLRPDIRMCDASQVAGLLESRSVDLAIGGLLEAAALASRARLVAFSRRRLALGEPRHGAHRLHVWAIARSDTVEHWYLRSFLCAWRWRGC